MITIDNQEYLNSAEAAKHISVSGTTFIKLAKGQGVQGFTIPGKGRSKFYKKSDVEKMIRIQPIP